MFTPEKYYILIFFCLVTIFQSIQAQTTTLVSVGTDGKLIYKPDAVGSVIPDFSGVGYKNSEEPIPLSRGVYIVRVKNQVQKVVL